MRAGAPLLSTAQRRFPGSYRGWVPGSPGVANGVARKMDIRERRCTVTDNAVAQSLWMNDRGYQRTT
jgi:hypothetical protein